MPDRGEFDTGEFYTGYLPQMPPRTAQFLRRVVLLVLLFALGVALVLTSLQGPYSVGFFEFGVVRDFTGVVRSTPYPVLEVKPPGQAGQGEPFYLVSQGKHGAKAEVGEFEGQTVQLQGSLLYRDGQTMIEIVPGSVELSAAGAAAPQPGRQALGRHTLAGEIVDSKCYFGLMKPGDGKPHRGCASLCIRGGIPPVFVVRDERGPATHLLLVDAEGRAVNQKVLDVVAEPLEITGDVVRVGDLWLLQADPETYRRLDASS